MPISTYNLISCLQNKLWWIKNVYNLIVLFHAYQYWGLKSETSLDLNDKKNQKGKGWNMNMFGVNADLYKFYLM